MHLRSACADVLGDEQFQLQVDGPVLVDRQVIGCNAQYGDGIKLRVEQGARVLVLLV